MNEKSVLKKWLTVSFVGICTASAAILLVPFLQLMPEALEKALSFAASCMLWLGLAVFIVATLCAARGTKKLKKQFADEGLIPRNGICGIISFSREKSHIVLYTICAAGVAISISDIVFDYISEFIVFPLVSIVFFSFTLHCMVDGENYKLYKSIKKGKSSGYEV